MQAVKTIESNIIDQWYLWTPSLSPGEPSEYNSMKIFDFPDVNDTATADEVNYSPQFNINGATTTSPFTHASTKRLSSNTAIIIAVISSVIGVVTVLCAGLWIRHIRQKKAKGNHPPRTMTTDAMRGSDMSHSQYIPLVLTPNKTHFAFTTRELPQEPGSRRSAEYETIFDEEAVKVGAQAQTPWSGSTVSTQVNRSTNSPRDNSRNVVFQDPESPTPKTRQLVPNSSDLLARFNAASELEDNDRNLVELSAGTPQQSRNNEPMTDPKH
ncbi:hypothetical protein BP5796_12527 [Coleophoma crateriformis]|uniref:Uncharacterized protein n=1 Tax=Coleophoma crateriformis TaxID=565419 RepID=A0A3D8Q7C0_9HELO|nr:hypothetical protein BP5796_12527 [Coleophoma crateriformis]